MNIYDVFISYRRSDGLGLAQALYEYLTRKGLRVFFDKKEMIDGDYFTTQIKTAVKSAPNYILIATNDVFSFRDGEDWVKNEIEIAIEEYEKNPHERTITVLTSETVKIPQKDTLPQSICNITDPQRISLKIGQDEAFVRVLNAVTAVHRRNIWFAAHRWLENSKLPRGRFANLNIVENILPTAIEQKDEYIQLPINVSQTQKGEQKLPLSSALSFGENHIYLIGQGGIGKTTALLHIMNEAYEHKEYSENAQVPIFVELSFAPDTYGALYEGGKSSFIRRSIYKQIRDDRTIKQVSGEKVRDIDKIFTEETNDVAVQPITDLLSKTTPAPEYLLLLDGLNEVSTVTIEETGLTVAQMVISEIDWLMANCPNVRVVLTGRSDEISISGNNITRLHLSGIETGEIQTYLENSGFNATNIKNILKDKNLCESLQIPLFLTMFATLSKSEGVSTQGEILRAFFNERIEKIYTLQERLAEVEKNVEGAASATQKNRINAIMQDFILDFVLPEIAWHMERKGEFYLRIREIRKIIEPIFTDTCDTAICGEFGQEIFSKYRKGASARAHTYSVAKELWTRLGAVASEVCEKIIDTCVLSLGVMQETNSKYGFVHQHIRDYFAAVKNINTLRLSVYLYSEDEKDSAFECISSTFKDEPVGYTVRKFIGEFLGEHKNQPIFADGKWHYGAPQEICDRTLIDRSLDVYRNAFDNDTGYALYSLLKILQESRGALAGLNLTDLDLSRCNLNGAGLGLQGLAARLDNAKINHEGVIAAGHADSFRNVCFNRDATKIINSGVGCIKIWEVKTGNLISSFNQQSNGDAVACFWDDEKQLLSACMVGEDIYICLWNVTSNELVKKIKLGVTNKIKEGISNARKVIFSPDHKYALVRCWQGAYVFSMEDFSMVCEVQEDEGESINKLTFVEGGSKIAFLIDNDKDKMCDFSTGIAVVDVLDIKTNSHKRCNIDLNCAANICAVGDDSFAVVEKIKNNCTTKIRIFDSNSLQQKNEFIYHLKPGAYSLGNFVVAKYSKDGNWFAITTASTVEVFSTRSNALIHSFQIEMCFNFDFDDLSKKIVLVDSENEIFVYELDNFSLISKINGASSVIQNFAFSPNNKYIATLSRDNKLRIFNSDTLELLEQTTINLSHNFDLHFGSRENTICADRDLCLVLGLQKKSEFPKSTNDIVFDRDGHYCAVRQGDLCQDCTIYDTNELKPICYLDWMRVEAFVGDRAVAICYESSESYGEETKETLVVIDLNAIKKIRETAAMDADVYSISISAEDITVLSSMGVRYFGVEKAIKKLPLDGKNFYSVCASKNCIAAFSDECDIYIWSTENLTLLSNASSILCNGQKSHDVEVTLSPDGRYLFESIYESTVVRDTSTLKEILKLDGKLTNCTTKYAITKLSLGFGLEYYMLYDINNLKFINSFKPQSRSFCLEVKLNADDTELAFFEDDNVLGIYTLTYDESAENGVRVERRGEIRSEFGLEFMGVNFNKVQLDHEFTEAEKDVLRQYGAIID